MSTPQAPRRQPIVLPACGLFLGTGIMNSVADYLVGSGRTHTIWCPQLFSPLELLDKILEDNQGNLVQYWGFSGGLSPITFARHHALEDVGLVPPAPDWQNGKFLTIADWVDPKKFADRFGAGVLKLVKVAAAKGIYTILLYTEANPEYSSQFQEAGGKYYLGYDFGERFTFRLDEKPQPDLKSLADDLVGRVRRHVDERHATGWGNVMATSSNFYIDYEIAGGADVPLTEDFAFRHLHMASALGRGLYRQYNLPIWGSHLAHEHYSWIPYASEHKFDLLRAAFYQKYMAGAKIIVNESGGWYLEAALVTDSPMFETPRVELGGIQNRDPKLSAPFVAAARQTYDKINYHSPVARAYRKEISDFYDFVKAHGTPAGQPETTIAIAKGNYDLCSHEYYPNGAVGGMFPLAEKNPLWFYGAPERGWNIVKNVFYPRPPVLAPWLNWFLSGTPFGMVDIVSFARDHATADFLSRYKALLFAGWNTASEKQYAELTRYVRDGGTLFISIPHLSTNTTRNYADYGVAELVHGGDFSELCGVRVKGRGDRFYWATAPDRSGELGFTHPRRFGILTTCMGNIEITDPTAETLVVDDEEMRPVLLRRRYGKGTVYFLNSWAYPGAMDVDEGPGATIGSPGLIGYIYRHIARHARGSVWITADQNTAEPASDCIAYSFFPQDGTICLQNIDFKNSHRCWLHYLAKCAVIELAPGEFRRLNATQISRCQSGAENCL
ncbi:MAG: hypothetical protein PCFJNLEI_02073 [Verrucomicrobiae bacterium]|nr:hypothetical protein [Verrucomicrobiae bacterium]